MAKHPTTRAPRLRSSLIGLIWLAAASAPALAQQTSSLRPPAPREDPSSPIVLTILTMVILVVATLFVTVFPSKRGHQD